MADQGSGGLLSPFLRSRRIAAVKPFLRGRVLDLGCGSGKLAAIVPPDRYLGVDTDEYSLGRARTAYPDHAFRGSLPPREEQFDTVAALAFIEHIPDPAEALREMAVRLRSRPASSIVCTTPHPSVEKLHALGARAGLFSREANEEHEALLDRRRMEESPGIRFAPSNISMILLGPINLPCSSGICMNHERPSKKASQFKTCVIPLSMRKSFKIESSDTWL